MFFLFFAALTAAIIFFYKWREATGVNGPGISQPDMQEVLEALRRIERKVDLARETTVRPVAPTAAEAPAAAPAKESPTMLSSRAEVAPTEALPVPTPSPTGFPIPETADAGPSPSLPGPSLEPAITPGPAALGPGPERPAWEREAKAILARLWSWLLVGEEHRPKGIPLEYAMAGTWLMRVGVVLLVTCVGWFLRWSMDHGILGPSGRVGLSFAAGVGLLAAGYRMMGKRYQVMGQGLMGGGVAALYFASYACGPMYHLLPMTACFALMALVTLTGSVVAARTGSQITAILAMLGGYATPAMLSTGSANFAGLYGYMFLLGGGILGLALVRNWRLLHYLTFIAHWGLVLGSMRSYRIEEHAATVIPFVVAFFFQHHAIILGYAFRRASPISLLEAVHQLIHVSLFAAFGYWLIDGAAGRPWPALLAIGAGAVFLGQTLAVLRRLPDDRLSLSVSLALAGFFTAWSVPLLLAGPGLTLAWSLMALAWLWIGLRIGSRLLATGSQILFLLAALRLGFVDLPRAYGGTGADADLPELLRGLARRAMDAGVFIACLFTASRWYRRQAESGDTDPFQSGLRISPRADLPMAVPYGTIGTVAFFAAFLVLFLAIHFEADRLFSLHPPLQSPGLLLVWSAFAAYLALRARSQGSMAPHWIAGAGIALVILRMVLVDWPAMGVGAAGFRFGDAGWQLAYRLPAHAAILVLVSGFGLGRFGLPASLPAARGYRIAATALLFLVLTLETRTVSAELVPGFRAGALSVVWALFAMGLVALGLRHGNRQARMAGLLLFAIVAGKVFLLDLSRLEMVWRVLSFMAVGAVLLLGSFAYLRASPSGEAAEPTPGKIKEPA